MEGGGGGGFLCTVCAFVIVCVCVCVCVYNAHVLEVLETKQQYREPFPLHDYLYTNCAPLNDIKK